MCHEAGLPVVPQGGNTSLVGASIPYEDFTGIVLSTSRLKRIRELDPVNNTVTVDAGCILGTIQQAASDADRLFPLSLGAEGTCQIGGNISTNAGGVGVLRYGTMRDLVLGLEVALPDGRIWDGLRGLRKDNTGYDLKQWFIGAEGTLGVITGAVLKLFPKPRETVTALAAVPDPDASLRLLAALQRETGGGVSGYEIMTRQALQMALDHIAGNRDPFGSVHPCYQLIELTGPRADGSLRAGLEDVLAGAMADGDVRDAVVAASEAQSRALWRLRESISEAQRFEGASIKHDVCGAGQPRRRHSCASQRRPARPNWAASASSPSAMSADGNIHFNMNQPAGGWSRESFMAEQPRFNPDRPRHRHRHAGLDQRRTRHRSDQEGRTGALQCAAGTGIDARAQGAARSKGNHESRQDLLTRKRCRWVPVRRHTQRPRPAIRYARPGGRGYSG